MDSIHDIIDLLLEKTEQDKINWLPNVTVNTFVAVIGIQGVSISLMRETPTVSVMRFRVLNEAGQVTQDITVDNINHKNAHRKLSRIYSRAHRRSPGDDSRLNRLKNELENV